jgi:hypothetical protein
LLAIDLSTEAAEAVTLFSIRDVTGGKSAGKGRPQQGKENLPDPITTGQARDHAGKAVGVSGKSIDHAARILLASRDRGGWVHLVTPAESIRGHAFDASAKQFSACAKILS